MSSARRLEASLSDRPTKSAPRSGAQTPKKKLRRAPWTGATSGVQIDNQTAENDFQKRQPPAEGQSDAELRRLLAADLPEISAAVAAKARNGDTAAARLVFDFLSSSDRDRPLQFELRCIDSAEGAAAAMSDVLQALASSRITLQEAERIVRLLKSIADGLDLAFFGDGHARHAFRAEWARRRKKGDSFDADSIARTLKDMSEDELNELKRALTHKLVLQSIRAAAEEGRSGDILKICDQIAAAAVDAEAQG